MKSTKFTQAQLGYLRQTPFWHLLDALRNGEIDLNKCMKCDDVVVHVLQMYKASKDAFYIGEKKMNIQNNDIKLVLVWTVAPSQWTYHRVRNQRLAL
ncbi:hypothetical protein ACSBR1_027200 [Camellia fascicularis]